jgi:general secretion pathway protein K
MPPDKARGLISAIKDWLDKDNEPTGSMGAEDDYYMGMATPYHCRNGRLATLSELLLVRGMTRELFYGKSGGKSDDKAGGPEADPLGGLGLKDVLTVHGDGQINVNTAGELVLRALAAPSVSQETAVMFARGVVSFRSNPANAKSLAEADWYRTKMVGFKDIGLRSELITTRSNVFTLHMTGVVAGVRKTVVMSVKRDRPAQLPMVRLPVEVLSRQVF